MNELLTRTGGFSRRCISVSAAEPAGTYSLRNDLTGFASAALLTQKGMEFFLTQKAQKEILEKHTMTFYNFCSLLSSFVPFVLKNTLLAAQ